MCLQIAESSSAYTGIFSPATLEVTAFGHNGKRQLRSSPKPFSTCEGFKGCPCLANPGAERRQERLQSLPVA